jgi:translation elongation factor EF-Ts
MAITALMVKDLREKSGAGMMDAKKALIETDGDMEAAIDWLRTKGLAKAAKKSGRTAAEGLVAVQVEGGRGVVVEVNSETDFVAKNSDFQQMVGSFATAALSVSDVEQLAAADVGGKTVADTLTDKIATIGENNGPASHGYLRGYASGFLRPQRGHRWHGQNRCAGGVERRKRSVWASGRDAYCRRQPTILGCG